MKVKNLDVASYHISKQITAYLARRLPKFHLLPSLVVQIQGPNPSDLDFTS